MISADLYRRIYDASATLLPLDWDTTNARVMLRVIGLQESGFAARRQSGGGPAMSFWQHEKGASSRAGLWLLLQHQVSRQLRAAADALEYKIGYGESGAVALWSAIMHNDILACVVSRCLLRTHPASLPGERNPDIGWRQYLACWNPGLPRPETWPGHWRLAWAEVGDG